MAAPVTFRWSQFLIKVGDGSPIDFDALGEPCGFTSKSMTWNNGTSEVAVPDCDTPDGASWFSRNVLSKSITISGTGIVSDTAFSTVWQPWFFVGAGSNERTLRILMNLATADSYGYVQGAYLLQDLELTGDRDAEGGLLTFTATMMSTGEHTWTAL